MPPKRRAPPPAVPFDGTVTDEMVARIYSLSAVDGAGKKQRLTAKQNPRDLDALLKAAAREAKQQDAASLKALGADPADQISKPGQRTPARVVNTRGAWV